MRPVPTYYELLEIDRSASPQEVRRAYLRLMKHHHPDVAGDRGAGVDLSFINRIYEALSDPVKRAAYDAELARDKLQRNPSATATRAPCAPPRPPNRFAWVLLALSGATVLALVVETATTHPAPAGSGAQAAMLPGTQGPAAQGPGLPALPSVAAIRRQALLGATSSPHDAVQISATCFNSARARSTPAVAQLCVVFDDAFLYSRTAIEAGLPPYYNAMVVRLRHSSALADFAAPDPLVDRLWKATFNAMMANLQQSAKALEESDQRLDRHPRPAKRDGTAATCPGMGQCAAAK